jgi:transcriptional regulator with XRE-family HTH domain
MFTLHPMKIPTTKDVLDAIRSEAKKQNVSIKVACAMADVTFETWCNWESGKCSPSMRVVELIAQALTPKQA